MRGLGSGSFDPKTLAILEAAFDEAWLTLKCNGIGKVRANELARRLTPRCEEIQQAVVTAHTVTTRGVGIIASGAYVTIAFGG